MTQSSTKPNSSKPSRSNQLGHVFQSIALIPLGMSLLFFNAGCRDEPEARIILFSASSTTQAMLEIETAFELTHSDIQLDLIFAGSHTLAMQINEGAPADIFISADRAQIDKAIGFAPPQLLIENQLVAITRSLKSASLSQAISEATTIILAHEDVPVGRYTRDALGQLNVWLATEPKVVSYEHSVQSVRTKIDMRQADLGFVYRTDAINTDQPFHVIEFPKNIQTTTQTWIARRNDTETNESPTNILYEFLTQSLEAKRIFTDNGFTIVKDSP